jgi:hypothetical protein
VGIGHQRSPRQMNRNVEPKRSSQFERSAGRQVRRNAGTRLVIRRKDIDGVTMVQLGGLTLLNFHEERDCSGSPLFAGKKFFELGFGENGYT